VVLCLLAFVLGLAMGGLDVSMNLHGVTVERCYGRPILSGFHAAFSAGGLAGAGAGALAAGAGVDVRLHLALVGAASAVVGVAWSRRFLPAGADAMDAREPLFVRPPRKVWALGAVAFTCLLIEGASADWSGVYLDQELGTTAGVAALGFTAFSVTMTIGRLVGDRAVQRFGPRALVRAGGLIAAGGFGAALLISQPWAAIVGFACLGAGMSSVVPIVFRAAGAVPGVAAGVALAAVSSTGYLGFVVGPAAIGGVAELLSLPVALSLLVVLGGAVAAVAPAAHVERAERVPAVPEAHAA